MGTPSRRHRQTPGRRHRRRGVVLLGRWSSYTISDTTQGSFMNDTADPRFTVLGARPGKIVAVHLSYGSRADQRGRRPAAPSYFFKPSSSLAASGSEIVRPAGTELLAFEGEIALVIGELARWVAPDAAWSHVASVTAAND